MAYDTGDVAEFDGIFEDPRTGARVDPTTVALEITPPVAAPSTITYPHANLVKVSAGFYRARVELTEGGAWRLRWVTSGTYQGAETIRRQVRS